MAIARALVANPQVILADEPTGNLSSRQGEEILQILQELNDSGITVVMVTHEPHVGRHSKRIVYIRDGCVTSDEPVAERMIAARVLSETHEEVRG